MENNNKEPYWYRAKLTKFQMAWRARISPDEVERILKSLNLDYKGRKLEDDEIPDWYDEHLTIAKMSERSGIPKSEVRKFVTNHELKYAKCHASVTYEELFQKYYKSGMKLIEYSRLTGLEIYRAYMWVLKYHPEVKWNYN